VGKALQGLAHRATEWTGGSWAFGRGGSPGGEQPADQRGGPDRSGDSTAAL